MMLRKKKKKGIKINYHYQKRHSVYIVVGIIVLLLLSFLIRNFGTCKIYSLSLNNKDYNTNNGLLVLMNHKTILKLSDIIYSGNIDTVKDFELTLCVEIDDSCEQIYTRSLKSTAGLNYKETLKSLLIDVYNEDKHSYVFTRRIRREMNKNLKLVISITTLEDKDIYVKIPITVKEEYANNKLF